MHIVELKNLPLLETHPENKMLAMQVSEIMASNVVSVELVVAVGTLLDVLEGCPHHGFPVVFPNTTRLAGTVTRRILSQVVVLSTERRLLQDPSVPLQKWQPIDYEEMMKCDYVEVTFESARQAVGLNRLHHVVDLRPYINTSSYTVRATASVASSFTLFRQLGLRTLPVVGPCGELCGVVTRKDLILDSDEELEGSESTDSSDKDGELLRTLSGEEWATGGAVGM
jgi:chloride channel 7